MTSTPLNEQVSIFAYRNCNKGTDRMKRTLSIMSFLGAVVFATLALAHTHISTWAGNSCTIKATQLYCWGSNQSGQRGNGTITMANTVSPTTVALGSSALAVDVYANGICAVASGLGVKCWGQNNFGIIGTAADPSSTPTLIPGTNTATMVTAGTAHACSKDHLGAVRCWGLNSHGQLGNGNKVNQTSVVTPPVSNVAALSAGSTTTCSVNTTGSTRCWGEYHGTALVGDSVSPTTPAGLSTGVTDIAVGSTHACAIKSGAVYCWGSNSLGQLGIAPPLTSSATPLALPAPMNANVVKVEAGDKITCAIKSGGDSYCWGSNTSNGRFGNGATTPAATHVPQAINGIGGSGMFMLATGSLGGCGYHLPTAMYYCWGSDQTDRIGDPGASHPELAPYPLAL